MLDRSLAVIVCCGAAWGLVWRPIFDCSFFAIFGRAAILKVGRLAAFLVASLVSGLVCLSLLIAFLALAQVPRPGIPLFTLAFFFGALVYKVVAERRDGSA